MNVCDICKKEKNVLVEADYTCQVKNLKQRIKWHSCEDHKGHLKGKGLKGVSEYFGSDVDLECKCGYCGKKSGSPDPDVLCRTCRETFGHAFFSEL